MPDKDLTEIAAGQAASVPVLIEGERAYLRCFEQAPVGAAMVTLDYHWLRVNEELCRLTGYSRDDLLSLNYKDITHPDEGPEDLERLEAMKRGEIDNFRRQARFVRKDGGVVWVRVVVRMVRGDADSPLYFLAFVEDINELKQALDYIKESEKRYRRITTNNPGILFQYLQSIDGAVMITFISEGISDLLGLESREAMDSPGRLLRMVHPEDRERVRRLMQKTLEGKDEYVEECRVRTEDGRVRWLRVEGRPYAEDGGAVLWHGVAVDVTDRKIAEEGRAREAEINSAMAELSRELLRVESIQHISERVLAQALKLTGSPIGFVGLVEPDREGMTFAAVSEPDSGTERPAWRALDDQFQESGAWRAEPPEPIIDNKPVALTAKVFQARNSRVVERFISTPALIDQDLVGQIAVANADHNYTERDLTLVEKLADYFALAVRHHRAVSELSLAREKAEKVARNRGLFLANMSHEIRTPMNAIIGLTEIVLDSKLDPEQRDHLNIVKLSAESLLSLLNDILDFSKIEAGKLEFETLAFSLRDSMGDTMKTLALRAHEKGLELACQVGQDVPDGLIGDPGRLRQIVLNLVGNAIKFTHRGEVVVRILNDECTRDLVRLHLSIQDTGIGIPRELQEILFSPFTQAVAADEGRPGTGLGLSISSQLVKMMNGRIWLESEVGRGTTFHLIVPFQRHHGPLSRPVPISLDRLQRLPVLVVDDNRTNRRILEEMLLNNRMRPTAVESAQSAMMHMAGAMARGESFPLVLIDANMPDTDGFELAARIRTNHDFRDTALIMLTSTGQRGDAGRCREFGIDVYLNKPIEESDLIRAIQVVLGTKGVETDTAPLITRHSLRQSNIPLKVLVADDDLISQKVAARLLEKGGCHVTVVGDGEAVVETVKRESFDLILMDIQMPRMNGLEATGCIREMEKGSGRRVPILAMTANAMKGDRERCLALGMDGYISKPIRTRELYDAIEWIVAVDP